MKAGNNNLTILATDVSGATISTSAGWSVYGIVGSSTIVTATVTPITAGFHNVAVTIPAGQGFLQVKNSSTNISVTPTFFDIDADVYDSDDVYGKLVVATSTTALPVTPSQTYGLTTITCKDNDAITETIQVPARFRPLTGWTDITIQAFPEARTLTATAAPLSGTYSATVINASAGIISYVIAEDVINNLVPSGVSSVRIYADLQGDDPSGYRKTMAQLNITVTRDYNQDT